MPRSAPKLCKQARIHLAPQTFPLLFLFRSEILAPRTAQLRMAHMSNSTPPGQLLRAAASIFPAIFSVIRAAADESFRVAAPIRPVHSIASAVMEGAGEPHLPIRGAGSHHDFSLRPSDASVLEKAAAVFLIDKRMGLSLVKPIEILARNARVVVLSYAPCLVRRPLREGGAFERDIDHYHGDHDARRDRGEEHDADRSFGLHVWPNAVNAAAVAQIIADTMSEVDPANAAHNRGNARKLLHRLEDLSDNVESRLETVRGRPYVVFHDAYRYFEDRFGMTVVGSAVVSGDRSPGVKRIRELRKKVRDLGVVCDFSEPHFNWGPITTIIEGAEIGSGTPDSPGVDVEDGPGLYFTMIRNLATPSSIA